MLFACDFCLFVFFWGGFWSFLVGGCKEKVFCYHTVDGRNPATLANPDNPLFVGIQGKHQTPGFLRWCEMDFATIHSIASSNRSPFKAKQIRYMLISANGSGTCISL